MRSVEQAAKKVIAQYRGVLVALAHSDKGEPTPGCDCPYCRGVRHKEGEKNEA